MCEYCNEENLMNHKKKLSSRRDEVYGIESIFMHHFNKCKLNTNRDFYAIESHIAGYNMYAEINYCPMCGRKLGTGK